MVVMVMTTETSCRTAEGRRDTSLGVRPVSGSDDELEVTVEWIDDDGERGRWWRLGDLSSFTHGEVRRL